MSKNTGGGPDDMTGMQVRGARGLLRWSAAELADKAGVGISTVQRIEAQDGPPAIEGGLEWRSAARRESVAAIHAALVKAGITFLPDTGEGIGIRGRTAKRRSG